ncbi:hypothetical protein [Nannocystis pusilla]|uniref:Uncharacterized protein n=1 Tax=Nannocystis pusilla TaxID=889268 RepID=A0ABS7U0B9_9BACT|nr:hypothetical protein [Nannocystis pusilla]MBZ5713962.1 hypothetical protein [Nannocystis pusilla]
MGTSTGIEGVEDCLGEMGYGAGVRGVVRRFRETTAALQELTLCWRPEAPESGAPVVERAGHPGGQFLLGIDASGTGMLTHLWPGRGRRVLGSGRPEHLRSEALAILRHGGPFGGPTSTRQGGQVVQIHDPHGGMRVALTDGSEIRALLLARGVLGVRTWPSGKFAIGITQDDLARSIEDDAERLSFGSTATFWRSTELHPLVGTIRADPYDLLLCALRADLAGLFAVRGDELLGLKVAPWDAIREIDAGPWLEGLVIRQSPSAAKATTATATEATSARAPGRDEGKATTEAPATKGRKRAAASSGGMSGGRGRRVRLKSAFAAALTQHLANVASRLPAGVLGAAFAVELLRALEAAALSDHPTLTGKVVELFSRLHKKGFLAAMPGDQAGRAALKLLAAHTPLVRKIHYRRWCFAFGDIHAPESELRARLGPIAVE